MERKDYAQKFFDVKNEILKEIRELLPEGTMHQFKEQFYVHYIEVEVATTEICSAVSVSSSGVVFHTHETGFKDEAIGGERIFLFEPDSFLDILENLKKELREEKLNELREIVKANKGKLEFDGTFWFKPVLDDADLVCDCKIVGLSVDDDNHLNISNIAKGETFGDTEKVLTDEDLDRFIAYMKKQYQRKYQVRVSGSFSRIFDIEASSYEEALALAQKEWEVHPLFSEDSNGEDWEDYTTYDK